MGSVVSNNYRLYMAGERMFERGERCPPKPSDDCRGNEPECLLWIGYRVAKAMDFDERVRIARSLNMPEPEWAE